jgi:hypothetical protein
MCVGGIRQFCKLQDEVGLLSLSKHQSFVHAAMTQNNLSARAYHRIQFLIPGELSSSMVILMLLRFL